MSEFTEYITKQNERWDSVANLAYGDPKLLTKIIDANPNVAVTPIIPIGTRLTIPILEVATVVLDSADLPPWKI